MTDTPSKPSQSKSQSVTSKKATKSQSGKSKSKAAPPLSTEELEAIQSDLATLRDLSHVKRQLLHALVTVDTTDIQELRRLYHALPGAASRVIMHVLSLDEEGFQRLLSQLGESGKGLEETRSALLPISPTLFWLRREARGIVNSWSNIRANAFYDPILQCPMVDLRVNDSIGNEIFRTRSDVEDITKLARAFLETSVDATKQVVEQEIDLSADFHEDIRSEIEKMRKTCKDFQEILRRASKKHRKSSDS